MFQIKYSACNTVHSQGELIYHTEKRDFHILIYTKTRARFCIDNVNYTAAPGCIVLLPPEAEAVYSGSGEGYCDDWINFYDEHRLLASFGIPAGYPVLLGADSPAEYYFMLITNAFHSGLPQSSLITDSLMTALFHFIGSHCSGKISSLPHYYTLLALRQKLYANPRMDYSIPRLAEEAHLSAVYFQSLYKKAFGVSCGADIINSRIENAKRLLSENSLSVEEVAERCGYHSAVHFSRQFRQLTGSSPTQWGRR